MPCWRRKKGDLAALLERKAKSDTALAHIVSRMDAVNASEAITEAKRRVEYVRLTGEREELIDKHNDILAKLAEAQRTVAFFDTTISELKVAKSLPECPVCLEIMKWGLGTIAKCGHLHCRFCVEKLKKCATCREQLGPDDWQVINTIEPYAPLPPNPYAGDNSSGGARSSSSSGGGSSSSSEGAKANFASSRAGSGAFPVVTGVGAPARYFLSGTKSGLVTLQVESILKHDPRAKILVYCQWNTVKETLLHAFRHVRQLSDTVFYFYLFL
jgi:hypothetical protein